MIEQFETIILETSRCFSKSRLLIEEIHGYVKHTSYPNVVKIVKGFKIDGIDIENTHELVYMIKILNDTYKDTNYDVYIKEYHSEDKFITKISICLIEKYNLTK